MTNSRIFRSCHTAWRHRDGKWELAEKAGIFDGCIYSWQWHTWLRSVAPLLPLYCPAQPASPPNPLCGNGRINHRYLIFIANDGIQWKYITFITISDFRLAMSTILKLHDQFINYFCTIMKLKFWFVFVSS